ncbi:guanine nucleotide binding protein, alpha subunit [Mycena floridula]|nr:guanine nucleotide binding protein, alpha subunit [Mycena floridula]
MPIARSTIFKGDPFAFLTAPPKNERPQDRAIRQKKEAEAQSVSNLIDAGIKAEKAALKNQRAPVKLLLLGQSESGKSTTLKNFRMAYAANEWNREKASWKTVIQLNLIRSIITIVETLQAEMNGDSIEDPLDLKLSDSQLSLPSKNISNSSSSVLSVALSDNHRLLRLQLVPLQRVETELRRLLGPGTEEVTESSLAAEAKGNRKLRGSLEMPLQSWKNMVGAHSSQETARISVEATEVLAGCCEYMKALWADKAVRMTLRKRKVNMQDSAGFFLDDLDAIARSGYEPSDNDIMRARMRTLGVQEYKIKFDESSMTSTYGTEWNIYDVGGSRTARHAWLPFFEGVNAIIFLAPVSCFDETLLEDRRVNRLEDSFLIWRTIVSSKLLSQTTMIVFLNKCDLLTKKLRSGIQFAKYVEDYGTRPNDSSAAIKFLKKRFKDVAKSQSPVSKRTTYLYATCVTDTKATAKTLNAVRDGILRENLNVAMI